MVKSWDFCFSVVDFMLITLCGCKVVITVVSPSNLRNWNYEKLYVAMLINGVNGTPVTKWYSLEKTEGEDPSIGIKTCGLTLQLFSNRTAAIDLRILAHHSAGKSQYLRVSSILSIYWIKGPLSIMFIVTAKLFMVGTEQT